MATINLEDLPKALNDALMSDPSSVLKPEMLDRMGAVFLDNPVVWQKCKMVLRNHRMVRDVEGHVRRAAHELANIKSIGNETRSTETAVVDIWSDAPVTEHVFVPDPYAIFDVPAAIRRMEPRKVGEVDYVKEVEVCLDPFVITRRIGHMQSKEMLLEVQFRTELGWRRRIIDRSTLLNARKIVDTAQLGLPVASDNAMELVSWLRRYEQYNRDNIPVGYASSSMGWQGDVDHPTHHGFLCGGKQIGGNGRAIDLEGSDGDMAEARDIRARGSFEKWVEVVSNLSHFPAVRIALYASLASVLIAVVDGPNGVIEWAGRTSSGKSTMLRIAQSVWRSASNQMVTWNSTIVGVEALAKFFCDMPLIIDDTSTAANGARSQDIGKVIYNLVAGRSRGRGTRGGMQAMRSRWRTIVLATGETPLGELAKAEGASARVLTFWSSPLGATSPETGALVNEALHELSEHFGHAGPRVVQWLCDNRDMWGKLRELYLDTTNRVRRDVCTPAAARLAEIVALLECAALVGRWAECFPWVTGSILDDPELIESIRGAVNLATTSSDRAYDAWEHLIGEAESKPRSWIEWGEAPKGDRDPTGGWLGFRRREKGLIVEYAWFPQQVRRTLENARFNPDAALRAWKDVGVLLNCERARFTSQCRPYDDRRKVRLYRLAANYPGHEMDHDADDDSYQTSIDERTH